MRILLTRIRVGAGSPSYSYRVHIPFPEISLERQALIAMHSDYGLGAGPLARLADVVAPMAYLEAAPSLEKHKLGRRIQDLADRLGAILLAAAFPEMTANVVPFRLEVLSAPPDTRVFATIDNVSGRCDMLAREADRLTLAGLGFRMEADR